MPAVLQEDKEAARVAFDKVKNIQTGTASLFEVAEALRSLGISSGTVDLYREQKGFDVNFDGFLEIYIKKKDEKDKAELQVLVQQSFEALGGKPNQQGVVDVNKLQDIFKFYGLDFEPEDFLARANMDMSSTILYDEYMQIFDIAGAARQ